MRQTQDAFPRVPEAKRGVPGCLGRMKPVISFRSAASMPATPSTPSSDVSAMEYPVAVMATTTTRAFASTDRLYA